MRFVLSILICFVAGLLSPKFINLTRDIIKQGFRSDPSEQERQDVSLLISIMSARENFDARESVRNTWVQHVNKSSEKYFFVIGKDSCKVHPADRVSKYSCEEWKAKIPEDLTNETKITSSGAQMSDQPIDPFVTFYVNHDLIIKRLCILNNLIKNPTKVNVFDLSSNNIVLSATFHVEHDQKDTLVCKNVETLGFPKHFEGKLVIDSLYKSEINEMACNVAIRDNSQIITYRSSLRGYSIDDVCTPVSVVYTIQDVVSLRNHINEKSQRQQEWLKATDNEEKSLQIESSKYKDIIFMDVVDVYRNVARKMLQFYNWCDNQNFNFHYLLKTDDDVFIDVGQVRDKLKRLGNLKNWWWSNFRMNWPVQKFGKWREASFGSMIYPPFPCGAGYVLSGDLVQFIAKNNNSLYCYQGEDVSVGIWLSPVNPSMYNNCWDCTDVCSPKACNRAELSVKEMYQVWNIFKKTRNVCAYM